MSRILGAMQMLASPLFCVAAILWGAMLIGFLAACLRAPIIED